MRKFEITQSYADKEETTQTSRHGMKIKLIKRKLYYSTRGLRSYDRLHSADPRSITFSSNERSGFILGTVTSLLCF